MKQTKIKPQPLNLDMINELPVIILGKRFNLDPQEDKLVKSIKKIKIT